MDALPDLLSEAVGDGTVIDTVEIGGGDTIAVTHGATYVYRSDGLLKDESVERFGHDIERLSVRTKRRKSLIRLESIDGEENFTVPSKVDSQIIAAMLEGILRTDGTVSSEEAVVAQFRFSELTLVITDTRLFEHVGSAVWDGEFEAVEYADLSGLDFERGSVATQVVLETDSRRRRVKVPNEHAGSVKRDIQEAVFGFYDVSSLGELRAEIADPEAEEEAGSTESAEFDSDPEKRAEASAGEDSEVGDSFVSAGWSSATESESVESRSSAEADGQRMSAASRSKRESSEDVDGSAVNASKAEIEALSDRVEALSQQVEDQTDLIESQGELIAQLVDELRRGR